MPLNKRSSLTALAVSLAVIGTAHAMEPGSQWGSGPVDPTLHIEGEHPVLVAVRMDLVAGPGHGSYAPVGARVGTQQIEEVLYLDQPCPLPIVGAETMYRFVQQGSTAAPGVAGVAGCWHPTSGDGFTRIWPGGKVSHGSKLKATYQKATFHAESFYFVILDTRLAENHQLERRYKAVQPKPLEVFKLPLPIADAKYSEVVRSHETLFRDVLREDDLAEICHDGRLPTNAEGSRCSQLESQAAIVAEDLNEERRSHDNLYAGYHDKMMMFPQLDKCATYAAAGNDEYASQCRREVLNAHDFLLVVALSDRSPVGLVWQLCAGTMQSNLAMGAGCIVAALNIKACATDFPKSYLADQTQCIVVLTSGNWTANPVAQRYRFDYPRPSKE